MTGLLGARSVESSWRPVLRGPRAARSRDHIGCRAARSAAALRSARAGFWDSPEDRSLGRSGLAVEPVGQLAARGDAELLEHLAQVVVDRVGADEQGRADLDLVLPEAASRATVSSRGVRPKVCGTAAASALSPVAVSSLRVRSTNAGAALRSKSPSAVCSCSRASRGACGGAATRRRAGGCGLARRRGLSSDCRRRPAGSPRRRPRRGPAPSSPPSGAIRVSRAGSTMGLA